MLLCEDVPVSYLFESIEYLDLDNVLIYRNKTQFKWREAFEVNQVLITKESTA
jgi:hypothetical protein